ncbi:MAG: LPS assembly lipoprotein LptE [Enterobacteriaceae bacterium]
MVRSVIQFLLCASLLVTAGCGFHLRGSASAPEGGSNVLPVLTFSSNDPYGPTTRAVREQLLLNNIQIVEDAKRTDIPSLRLLGENSSQSTASIFRDGKTAEYQIVMTLNAQVLFPGDDLYPLQVKVFRAFFDNPLAALAKDAEQDLLTQEMRTQAAQRLVRKLIMLEPIRKGKTAEQIDSRDVGID